jgi:hypothetical protein
MSSEVFDFFQDHSHQFLEMALSRDKIGKMNSPDGYGKRTGNCGDTVEFSVGALYLALSDLKRNQRRLDSNAHGYP